MWFPHYSQSVVAVWLAGCFQLALLLGYQQVIGPLSSDCQGIVLLAPGIFIPSLAVGGAWGRVVGMVVQAALSSAGSSLVVSLPAYAVSAPCRSLHSPRNRCCRGTAAMLRVWTGLTSL